MNVLPVHLERLLMVHVVLFSSGGMISSVGLKRRLA